MKNNTIAIILALGFCTGTQAQCGASFCNVQQDCGPTCHCSSSGFCKENTEDGCRGDFCSDHAQCGPNCHCTTTGFCRGNYIDECAGDFCSTPDHCGPSCFCDTMGFCAHSNGQRKSAYAPGIAGNTTIHISNTADTAASAANLNVQSKKAFLVDSKMHANGINCGGCSPSDKQQCLEGWWYWSKTPFYRNEAKPLGVSEVQFCENFRQTVNNFCQTNSIAVANDMAVTILRDCGVQVRCASIAASTRPFQISHYCFDWPSVRCKCEWNIECDYSLACNTMIASAANMKAVT